ncbi:MAG: type III pantothenate kinase [Phycisphaerales bacterium]|nr:type III pantothenate kinase [Phycisphaerales bacterium]
MSSESDNVSVEFSGDLPSLTRPMIAVAIGNTRTRVGIMAGTECLKAQSLRSSEPQAIAEEIQQLWKDYGDGGDDPVIVLSTVSNSTADSVEQAIESAEIGSVYRFGRDIPIPVRHTLTKSGEKTVGQDRLLCAIGAYRVVKQACIVVDLGTAITVDFVDGEGVFHGGAILPGIGMMFEALHEKTAHLPQLKYEKQDPSDLSPAKQTDLAMQLGVNACVHGSIRWLAERYAEFYEGYPQIIVTGGDMGVLEGDELIEAFVPDLQLHGIRAACLMLADADGDDAP